MIEYERYLSKFKPIRTYNGINLYATGDSYPYDAADRSIPQRFELQAGCPYCGSGAAGIALVDPIINEGWMWVKFECGVVAARTGEHHLGLLEPTLICRISTTDAEDDAI